MVFNSIQFFIFFPAVTLLYFALPYAHRWFVLLVASCYFYMALIPKYIVILFLLIIVDYYAGLLIESCAGAEQKTRRKIWLFLSILANIGILVIFKYFNFINANLGEVFSRFGLAYDAPRLSLILPIGLSFHTFQSLSYTIEVYLGRQKAERSLKTYALYVLFFPQLVAGPIERPQNLLHQFGEKHDFVPERVVSGLRLMLTGFFKKVVIADGLSLYVDAIYGHVQQFEGPALILATVFFAFEIYCDFSGYTDIARGAARVLGFDLMKNFRRPYFATSVTEFWHRWHISLSTWFRDYVYIPLGGSRGSYGRPYFNLFSVFVISGLWHGASWNFVIWGALNGLFVAAERFSAQKFKKKSHRGSIILADATPSGFVPKSLPAVQDSSFKITAKRLFTFGLICFTWIFFRARSLKEAAFVYEHFKQGLWPLKFSSIFAPQLNYVYDLAPALVGLTVILVLELQTERSPEHHGDERWNHTPGWIRWSAYVASALTIMNFGAIKTMAFIYFQF